MLYLSFPERRGTAPPPRARSVFRCGLCAGFFLLCVERTALKKVTIEGTRGGSPRRPGRAGKLAGRWGSYASRAAPTVGVGGARQRQESAWVPVGPGSQYSFRSHSGPICD